MTPTETVFWKPEGSSPKSLNPTAERRRPLGAVEAIKGQSADLEAYIALLRNRVQSLIDNAEDKEYTAQALYRSLLRVGLANVRPPNIERVAHELIFDSLKVRHRLAVLGVPGKLPKVFLKSDLDAERVVRRTSLEDWANALTTPLEMIFVCPKPDAWSRVFLALERAWKQQGRSGVAPPRPLILSGWWGSDDYDKAHCWQGTIEWARNCGLENLIPQFTVRERYEVAELSVVVDADEFVSRFSFHEPKPVPSRELLDSSHRILVARWSTIAGPVLAETTQPWGFSGNKKRRLNVLANPGIKPPWGEWNQFLVGHDRSSFTAFRRGINEAIAPHEVDSVIFNTARW